MACHQNPAARFASHSRGWQKGKVTSEHWKAHWPATPACVFQATALFFFSGATTRSNVFLPNVDPSYMRSLRRSCVTRFPGSCSRDRCSLEPTRPLARSIGPAPSVHPIIFISNRMRAIQSNGASGTGRGDRLPPGFHTIVRRIEEGRDRFFLKA